MREGHSAGCHRLVYSRCTMVRASWAAVSSTPEGWTHCPYCFESWEKSILEIGLIMNNKDI